LAAVIPLHGESESLATADLCEVTVVYEDAAARDLALCLCDGLIKKFDPDLKFLSSWWGFKYLGDAEIGREAGQGVARSDLVLVSVNRAEGLPFGVIAWFEHWLPKRNSSAGALVLLQKSSERTEPLPWQDRYLCAVAQRANLDYLQLWASGSASESSYRLREDLVVPDTAGLEQLPKHQYHSSGWGINE